MCFNPCMDVDRIYLPVNIGRHGMLQVHQTVEEKKRTLEKYLKNSDALKLGYHEDLLNSKETKLAHMKDQMKNRKQIWQGKYIASILKRKKTHRKI